MTRFVRLPAVAALLCAIALSCQATLQNNECRSRIHDCLGHCPARSVEPAATPGTPSLFTNDHRTQCEKNCHSLCK
ncbi:MAG: hypothetical protein ISR64_11870 [Deltaproteobacteria bacterium]|nr:hypothetical protein [Deltaproteobacteria bacterium]